MRSADRVPSKDMTEPTPISEQAVALQDRITRLTRELEDETDTESRGAIIEQIEILKAELADETSPEGESRNP
jgi:hypothetical protein